MNQNADDRASHVGDRYLGIGVALVLLMRALRGASDLHAWVVMKITRTPSQREVEAFAAELLEDAREHLRHGESVELEHVVRAGWLARAGL